MKIINFDYNFTFEIPDDYKENAKSDYYPYALDAYMTMLILKEIIKRKNTSISKIIEDNPHIKYHSLDGYTL